MFKKTQWNVFGNIGRNTKCNGPDEISSPPEKKALRTGLVFMMKKKDCVMAKVQHPSFLFFVLKTIDIFNGKNGKKT